MSILGGYVLKARKIYQSKLSHYSPCSREVWDLLIVMAKFSDEPYSIGNKKVLRGQACISVKEIQDFLHWKIGKRKLTYTTKQILNSLKFFKDEKMITLTRHREKNIITILNFDLYQIPQNYISDNVEHNRLPVGYVSLRGVEYRDEGVQNEQIEGVRNSDTIITESDTYDHDSAMNGGRNGIRRGVEKADEGKKLAMKGGRFSFVDDLRSINYKGGEPMKGAPQQECIYNIINSSTKNQKKITPTAPPGCNILMKEIAPEKLRQSKNDYLKIAHWMWLSFSKLHPFDKTLIKSYSYSWMYEAYLMNVVDKIELKLMIEVFKYVLEEDKSNFWKYTIASISGFRKNFSKIFAAYSKANNNG